MSRLLLMATLISGLLAQWDPLTPLSQADASFIGEAAGDESGWIQSAGDVNGDGFDDILISAWKNDEGAYNAGQAYLFLGSETPDWGMDHDISQADASFIGEAAGDQAGSLGRYVGDINGDGYDDFAISAFNNDEAGTNAGKVYLFLGADPIPWTMDMSLADADAAFLGESASDKLGQVGPAGDVNGDGYDDFLLGAVYNDDVGNEAGQAYLFLGRAEADWGMAYSISNADASFPAESPGDRLTITQSAETAGDVNGDGLDDFLLGTPRDDEGGTDAGKVYLLLGRTEADWGMDFDLAQADASFLGENHNDYLYVPTCAGDLNEDGLDDFIMGAGWNDAGGYNSGHVYLILGRETADWGLGFDLAGADASFIGQHNERVHYVRCGGDLNGDGHIDLLLGSVGADNEGKCYVLMGNGQANWGMAYQLTNTHTSFIGEADADEGSFPTVSLGDVNGDGLSDIGLGAGFNNEGGSNAGQCYIIYGYDPSIVNVSSESLPKEHALHQNYPNPFNPSTSIAYTLPTAGEMTLSIFDLEGKLIRVLKDGNQPAGDYRIHWNGFDDAGDPVVAGVYFCRLSADNVERSIKMVLME